MKNIFTILLALLAATAGYAQEPCYSRGVAYCILNDGSGKSPVSEAGEVFVGTTADAAPVWTAGTYASAVAVNTGKPTLGNVKQTFYYWARAKEGYTFIGWNTTPKSKTPMAGSADCEGRPWTATYTHWAAGTAAEPKEKVLYAIFEKAVNADDEPADRGDGVAFAGVRSGGTYAAGSTAKDWSVHLDFAETLAYSSFVGYGEGFGVNKDLVKYVTCKAGDTVVRVVDVKVSGTFAAEGADAHASITLPSTVAVGDYVIHLPYGLFNTRSGRVTASCDVVVHVTPDTTPLVILSMNPTDGFTWDSKTDSDDFNGIDVTASFKFNKPLAKVVEDGVTLQAAYGATYLPTAGFISLLDKNTGMLSFGALPNGDYTLHVPAGAFVTTSGMTSEAVEVNFSVKGSDAKQWALPVYTAMVATPANNATVKCLDKVTFSLSRKGFAAPVAIAPNAPGVVASMVREVFEEGVDYSDPDNKPTFESEDISGIVTSVVDGSLVLTFTQPVVKETRVVISVPQGVVTNFTDGKRRTAREMFEEGGCTNPALSLILNVLPDNTGVDPEQPDPENPDPEQPDQPDPDQPDPADPWALPTYSEVTVTPAEGGSLRSLSTVSISLYDEVYDDPIGIMPGMAGKVEGEVVKGGKTTPITGITAKVNPVTANLVITLPQPISEACRVNLTIPKGMTNNLAMPVATMTPQEIFEEGGCTNPELHLSYLVVPGDLPVRDVTGIGYDTEWVMDADGNYVKDEHGQYLRYDKYDSLIDAQLTPTNSQTGEGDRVTVMYFWYDEDFVSINYKGGASVTNLTTGSEVAISSVTFKTGGDSYRNNVIELRLSTEAYIQSAEYHQGVYEVVLPGGIATTAEGVKNAGYTFRFTYGDPAEAYRPEALDLDPWIGYYEAIYEEGEESTNEFFSFVKGDDGTYYVERLCDVPLSIPVEARGTGFVLPVTDNADGLAFMSLSGTPVTVAFQEYEGDRFIYLDQYALFDGSGDYTLGGFINFRRVSAATAIADVLRGTAADSLYDLQGRRVRPSEVGKGIVIDPRRRKVIVK